VEEKPYEISGDSKAVGSPRKGRLTLESKSQRLFYGSSFYFYGEFRTPSKEELISLVETGHGSILKQPPLPSSTVKDFQTILHVICDPNLSSELATEIHLKTGRAAIDFNWILDCVSFYDILDVKQYKLEPALENILETQNSMGY